MGIPSVRTLRPLAPAGRNGAWRCHGSPPDFDQFSWVRYDPLAFLHQFRRQGELGSGDSDGGSMKRGTGNFSVQFRFLWRRLLRRGKFLLGHDPVFLPLFMRLTPLGTSREITEHTDLVVEGFPRSGNTFTVFALENAASYRLRIASHVHHPSQVKLAVSRGVPTMLVVREPVATLSSYLAFGQHGRPASVLKEYSGYLRELVPYVDLVLICDFTEVVSNLSGVIDRFNDRFSTAIPHFDQSEENVDRVFEEIARQHRLMHRRQDPVHVAPRPSAGRHDISDRARSGILDPRHEALLADALDLYDYFAAKASQQKEIYLAGLAVPPPATNGRSSARRSSPLNGSRAPKRTAPTTARSKVVKSEDAPPPNLP